ncbi:hypothetical protein [Algisphaera agarilytica]|uniref:VanZ family protein n=1 Tax=Algisphaera agarilytica TaxID=1385975 RepID=A0A7X0H542_9BACT|nr:hypothetical protein [Algisphaera agarilytica]MBB6429462.1 VanZ family protein [Algisphaera agarilytica]
MSLRFGLATLLAGVLLIALIAAANFALIPPIQDYIPAGDKLMHFLLMGGLALLANLAWHRHTVSVGAVSFMAGSLVVGVLFSCEEVTQIWLESRTFSWLDLAMNWLGVVAASLVAMRLIQRARGQRRAAVRQRRSLATGRSRSSHFPRAHGQA